MELNLPKKYLSYSAFSLWNQNKDEYRRRYYEDTPTPDNAYTMFGREIAEALEGGQYPQIPKFSKPEFPISIEINNVPLLGYIDSFAPRTRSFLEYKTGIRKEDGSPRWTQLDVEKHKQLPFYAMLIQAKYGRYHPKCKLVWLETRWKQKEERLGSVVLTGDSNELELTGHHEVFIREIYQKEIDQLKAEILEVAHDISKDYTLWKKNR